MTSRLFYPLLIAVLLLTACEPDRVPDPYRQEWCYIYDFGQPIDYVNLVSGTWIEGVGIATDSTGELIASFVHTLRFRPNTVGIQIARGADTSGNIHVAAIGDIFGVPVSINEDISVLMPDPLPMKLFGPDSERLEEGNTASATITADQQIIIKSLIVAGSGASPYPVNPCADGGEPTDTPEPVPTSTPDATQTPEPSNTPDNCYLHNDEFRVYADGNLSHYGDIWAETDFNTSPACTYVIEVSRQYENAAGPADAFYSVRTEWDFCTMETAGRSWTLFYDFRLSPHTFTPSINGFDGAAMGQWVDGVGFVASDIRQSGSVRVNVVEIRSNFPVVSNNIERYACLVYQWVPGSVPAPPRNNWSIGTLLSNNTYDQLLTHGSPDGIRTGGGVGRMLDGALVYGLKSAQCNGCTAPFENTGYAAIVGLALSGSGPNPLTGHYEWITSENLIFESVPGIEFLWHAAPPPRHPAGNYLYESTGTGHPFRFRITELPGNDGYLTVRVYAGEIQPSPTPSPTIEQSPTPTLTPSATVTRTPIGYNGGTPSKTPSPSRTPVTINTWTPQPPTVTRTPSVTVVPPTIAATPTLITVTPQTYTPVYSPTPMPSLPGPTMTPWGTPVHWGTPWGTPVDWGTPWLPGGDGFSGICCGDGSGNYDDAVYGWLATAAAEVNNLPDSIAPYVPNPNTSQIFGYAKWLLSCVSAQEIVGRTLSPIVCHLSFGLQIILFLTSVYLSIRLIVLAFRIGAWIVRRMAGSILSMIFGFLGNLLRNTLVFAARFAGRMLGRFGVVLTAILAILSITGAIDFDEIVDSVVASIEDFLAPIFAPILDPINKIAEMTTMVFDIVLGIFSFLATAFFEGFNSLIGILIDYASSPVLSIPTLPQCTTAPMGHNLCALWYLLDWTFLAENTPGALIIPLIVVGLDIFMIAYIVRRVFNIIRTGERTIGNE